MSKSETEDLQAWLKANDDNANIRYKLKDNVQGNENEAYDLEVLYGDKWLPVADANKKQADDAAIKAVAEKVATAKAEADYAVADEANIKTEIQGLVDAYNALTADQKKDAKAMKVKEDINKKIEAYNKLEAETTKDIAKL